MSKVKVGLVQMSCSNDAVANMGKAIRGIREAAAKGAPPPLNRVLCPALHHQQLPAWGKHECDPAEGAFK